MFAFVGFLIGLNLMIRVGLGETRELQAYRGESRLRWGDIPGLAMKGAPFLLVPIAIGWALDWAFGTQLTELFD